MFQEIRYEVSLNKEEHRSITNALGHSSIGSLLREALLELEKEEAEYAEAYGSSRTVEEDVDLQEIREIVDLYDANQDRWHTYQPPRDSKSRQHIDKVIRCAEFAMELCEEWVAEAEELDGIATNKTEKLLARAIREAAQQRLDAFPPALKVLRSIERRLKSISKTLSFYEQAEGGCE